MKIFGIVREALTSMISFRSHLREIRDRSVLRLFESNEVAAAPQILSGNPGIPQPLPQQGGHWDQDPVRQQELSIGNLFTLPNLFPELLQRARVRHGIPTSTRSQKQSEFILTFRSLWQICLRTEHYIES